MGYYLSTDNAYERLLKEYRKYNSLVVAYDFDNTVFDYHGNGWTFHQTIDLLRELKERGCYLIVFTANEDEEFVADYCKYNKIPFDSINENPPFCKSEARKIYYNILLDDRAGLQETYKLLTRLIKEI